MLKTLCSLHVVLLLTLLFPGCGKSASSTPDNEKELTQYETEKLSSSRSLRENSIKGPVQVDITSFRLRINGLVNTPREFTYSEALAKFKSDKRVVPLFCVEGWDVNILWEGIHIKDILADSGIKPNARIVIFHSADGYTTSLPLDYILQKDILLAHHMNGITLPVDRGYPFAVVAEDKWGYKWAKWVTRIELSDNANYRGFWEKRGYNNKGDVNDSYREIE